MSIDKRYLNLSSYLKKRFNSYLTKISIDAGFSCPTRDGSIASGGCIYCNEDTLRHKGSILPIGEQIRRGIEFIRRTRKKTKCLAYYQVNTGTYESVKELRKIYSPAIENPDIAAIAISTRPDTLSDEVLNLLLEIRKQKPLWLEMGLQSANNATLKTINRGHTAEDFKKALMNAKEKGIDVCAHVIIGLPGETEDDMLSTIRFLTEQKIWGIKFHQLDIVKDTPLERLYSEGKIKTLSLEEYSNIVVKSLELLPPDTIIHRLSGSTKKDLLIAPLWGPGKKTIKTKIEDLLKRKNTQQGALYKPK